MMRAFSYGLLLLGSASPLAGAESSIPSTSVPYPLTIEQMDTITAGEAGSIQVGVAVFASEPTAVSAFSVSVMTDGTPTWGYVSLCCDAAGKTYIYRLSLRPEGMATIEPISMETGMLGMHPLAPPSAFPFPGMTFVAAGVVP